MSSAYLSLHFHLVFSTKNHEPTIRDAWKTRLHDYLGGTIRGLEGFPEGIGGMADHVHLLIGLVRVAQTYTCAGDYWPSTYGEKTVTPVRNAL